MKKYVVEMAFNSRDHYDTEAEAKKEYDKMVAENPDESIRLYETTYTGDETDDGEDELIHCHEPNDVFGLIDESL